MTRKTSDYEIGYGRPPRHSQWRPGQSGNPKGRPRDAKNERTILREVLGTRIPVQYGHRTRKVCVREAIFLKIVDGALKGDARKAELLFKREDAIAEPEKPLRLIDGLEFLTTEELETLEQILERGAERQRNGYYPGEDDGSSFAALVGYPVDDDDQPKDQLSSGAAAEPDPDEDSDPCDD